MSSFFEIFNPSQRHGREQQDFDKVRRFENADDQPYEQQHGVDLDGGTAKITLPRRENREKSDPEPDES